jgi:hypothetical protein
MMSGTESVYRVGREREGEGWLPSRDWSRALDMLCYKLEGGAVSGFGVVVAKARWMLLLDVFGGRCVGDVVRGRSEKAGEDKLCVWVRGQTVAVPLATQTKSNRRTPESRYVLPQLQIGVVTVVVPWPLHLPWSYYLSRMDPSIYPGMPNSGLCFITRTRFRAGQHPLL